MTLEYQKNILRYLFQNKVDLTYIDSQIFDVVEMKALYELYYNYVVKYKTHPDKNNFIEYVDQQHVLKAEAKTLIRNQLYWVFETIEDINMIKETLLSEIKKKKFKMLIKESLGKLESITSDSIEDFYKEILQIKSLSDNSNASGLFLLRDLNKYITHKKEVYPTYLNTLNRMTTYGGFQSPELIVWMGPPKSFKTGLLIKFATEYMKDGLDVFYGDFENGETQILNRFKQCLLECQVDEIWNFDNELKQIKDKLLNLTGTGEVFIKKYIKRKDHFGNIETDIIKWIDEGYKPKLMIYDYIDIMGCSDRSIKDTRLKIQQNYADAAEINDKYDTFAFTVSKMKQSAIDKEWPTADDVAEDFEKIYNAHGVFAIMRNEKDIEEGLGRIIPIVQRQGSSYTKEACMLEINPVNFIIREL